VYSLRVFTLKRTSLFSFKDGGVKVFAFKIFFLLSLSLHTKINIFILGGGAFKVSGFLFFVDHFPLEYKILYWGPPKFGEFFFFEMGQLE